MGQHRTDALEKTVQAPAYKGMKNVGIDTGCRE
jgi:hypothetical protein